MCPPRPPSVPSPKAAFRKPPTRLKNRRCGFRLCWTRTDRGPGYAAGSVRFSHFPCPFCRPRAWVPAPPPGGGGGRTLLTPTEVLEPERDADPPEDPPQAQGRVKNPICLPGRARGQTEADPLGGREVGVGGGDGGEGPDSASPWGVKAAGQVRGVLPFQPHPTPPHPIAPRDLKEPRAGRGFGMQRPEQCSQRGQRAARREGGGSEGGRGWGAEGAPAFLSPLGKLRRSS